MGDYAWIIWVALIIVFAIIEMVTGEFTFLMLSIGSVAGLIMELVGAPWYWDVIVAAVVAVLLLFTLRPPLLRRLRRSGDKTPSNMDAIVGQAGRVLVAVTALGGQVKLANGETWSAKPAPDATALPAGTEVRVRSVTGASVVVEVAAQASGLTH